MIAPVLPGETLNSATIQARVKTDALAVDANLLGWWCEHYLFYVKLTDLAGRDDFTEMLLDYSHDLSAYNAAADVQTYHAGPGVNFTQACLDRVVEDYFRDEGDGTINLSGMPQAQINHQSWLDSAKLQSVAVTQEEEFPGQNPVVPDDFSATFGTHYTQWEHMRAIKMTSATYEDWIAAFGIKTDTKQPIKNYKPELLRYTRDWQYPSTVVDGGTGGTTSACVWSITEKADKRRLFREPGFIFGVTVARPKVYLSKQLGSGIGMLNDAYAWLPAVLHDQPFTSLKQFDNTPATGPLGTTPSEEYWVDLRDLFLYGDQFVNFDISSTPAGFVALPTTAMQKRYAATADIDAMFVDAAGGFNLVRQDGVCQMSIMGMQSDTT